MKSFKHLIAMSITAVLILSGCSSSSVKTDETEEAPQESSVPVIHEFDHKTNLIVSVGDYTIEITGLAGRTYSYLVTKDPKGGQE